MPDIQQFYVGPDRFVVRDVFLSFFLWLYCYNKYGQEHMFCLDVLATLGLLQY